MFKVGDKVTLIEYESGYSFVGGEPAKVGEVYTISKIHEDRPARDGMGAWYGVKEFTGKDEDNHWHSMDRYFKLYVPEEQSKEYTESELNKTRDALAKIFMED